MDSLSREFYERVRAGYLEMMRAESDRWVRIDGTPDVSLVQNELRRQMDYALKQYRRTHAHASRSA